ncbi:RNA polymerase ii mediator complex component [Colletotrichum truncatum]|uniref:RNA polymerase ii mediator complex component n=1 Tax=Colletotrichum truncatum TaxID=5467 RepID=A0ACC3YFH7_COLTU|nr:RNA polymerase ii mediator complex component [Colletotrichum truncatum]KAF6788325.1 RNA polymerase ii mediator complex component [Colletotrichum truncatum]
MARINKQKACIACTESKRRCDKGFPSCSRCEDRDVDCHYPPAKRRRRYPPQHPTPLGGCGNILEPDLNTTGAADIFTLDAGPLSVGLWNAPWTDLPILPDFPTTTHNPQPPSASHPQDARTESQTNTDTNTAIRKATVNDLDKSRWFIAPSTWRIDRWPTYRRNAYPTSVLTNFTRGLQSWVRRWVLDGHNPFIHRSLYAEGNYFPLCLQDALTSASLYHHKTPQNEVFVHRILDERVAAMMASSSQPTTTSPQLETRDHLARVQALFVYTVIRLFDGSVTQRAAAEDHLPTLSKWCDQLWESVVLDADALSKNMVPNSKHCPGSAAKSSRCNTNDAVTGAAGSIRDDDNGTYDSDLATWDLWVITESIRRTWLIVTCTIGVYGTLKGEWSECPGGAIFTARAGLWDAPSAPRWAAMCRKVAASSGTACGQDGNSSGSSRTTCDGRFFIPSFDSDSLLMSAAAIEVDEFARHLFTIIWGLDRVESWALQTASLGEVSLVY